MKISDPIIQEALNSGSAIVMDNYPEHYAVVLTNGNYYMYPDYPSNDVRHLLESKSVELVDCWKVL